MVLNNWYIMLNKAIGSDNPLPVKSTTGSTYTNYSVNQSASGMNLLLLKGDKVYFGTSATTYGGYFIGSGTTPPQPTDYKLEEQITTEGITSIVSDVGATRRITITNNSKSEITISEIGVCGYATTCYILTERTLLETPITISPNESGTIDYKIELQLPEE